MSKSKQPIPPHHLTTALKVAKDTNQSKVYITEDGHAYVEANKGLLDFHCKSNQKTYWEVDATEEAPKEPAAKKDKEPAKPKADDGKKEGEEATTEISEADKAKMVESAKAAGAPDGELLTKLKGMTVEKLAAKTKAELVEISATLKIAVTEDDTKQVIAEAIFKTVNAE